MTNRKQPHLNFQLAVLTVARLFLNTGLRLTYPFLPELARGLDVSLATVSQFVTFRNLTGLLSPVFGPLADRFGRRPVIVAAMLFFGLGCFVVVLWPAYWPLGVTLVVIALAKAIYDPAMQAYLGDKVPYRQRGKAIAVTEFSWAGALLLGGPAVGLVIQRQGWQAPFFWLGILGLAILVLLWRVLPANGDDLRHSRIAGLADTWRVIKQERVIWAAFMYILLAMAANELLLIVYGDWMESSYDLNLASLGLAAGVIGGAEIVGELVAGWSVDHFGKRPVIITSALLTSALYFSIPYTGSSLTAALATIFTLFLTFEITVVGGIPLMTEIVPGARGVVLSMVVAASALGRAIGSSLGPQVWQAGDLPLTSFISAALMLLATLILIRWVREQEPVVVTQDLSG